MAIALQEKESKPSGAICDVCGTFCMEEEGVWVNRRFFICRYCLRDVINDLINDPEEPWEALERVLVDEIIERARARGREPPANQ